jgi:parallel beta-helix repeat protein
MSFIEDARTLSGVNGRVAFVGPARSGADFIVNGYKDEAAINNAAALVTSNGSFPGVIYLLPGYYYTQDIINLYSNLLIEGLGGSSLVVLQKTANQSTGMFANINSPANGANNNITLKGITVDMNKANNSGSSASGVRFNGGNNLVCIDIISKNAKGNGFYFRDGATNFKLINCFGTACNTHCVSIQKTGSFSRPSNFVISGGEYTGSTNQGLNLDQVDDFLIEDVKSYSHTKNGIAGFYATNGIIKNNRLYSNTQSGADIEGAINVIYEGNYSYSNTLNGLVVERYPIDDIRSQGTSFIDNKLYNNFQGGITVQASDDTIIRGNRGYNNSRGDATYPALAYIKYEGADTTSYSNGGVIEGNTYLQSGTSNPQYLIADNGSNPNLGSKNFKIGGNILETTGNTGIIAAVKMVGQGGTSNILLPDIVY